MQNKMYFLYEHPDQASSWKIDKVQDVMMMPGVRRATGDMCQYGMEQEEDYRTIQDISNDWDLKSR